MQPVAMSCAAWLCRAPSIPGRSIGGLAGMDDSVRCVATFYAQKFYPLAELIVVGGSSAGVRRPRSDIDLLVIGPAEMFREDAREAAHTDRFHGELFEVFACTPDVFHAHALAGVGRFRPVSAQMLVDGATVLDTGQHNELVSVVRSLIAAGPKPSPAELAQRRYSVTTTLDDLLDAVESTERAVLAATLFQRLGEFLLLANGRWIGSGRWLLRRLLQWDETFTQQLGSAFATTDVVTLERLTLEALEPYGGRLMEGHRHGEPK